MSYYLDNIQSIIDEATNQFRAGIEPEEIYSIPSSESSFSMQRWYKIPEVICVYVDIRNSTGMSAARHSKTTAKIYQYFVDTAVRVFHEFNAEYIDIKGDGVFALFSKGRHFKALAATVTFKTFCDLSFVPNSKSEYGENLDIGVHMGIDQKTILVKQIGLKDNDSRDRRKNEVWAGKPINMASKLASKSGDKNIFISDRFHKKLESSEKATKSCGCKNGVPSGDQKDLWYMINVKEFNLFDFEFGWKLSSHWCIKHGREYCEDLLYLDSQI